MLPVKRNGAMDLIEPNTSVAHAVVKELVCVFNWSNSSRVPWDTMNSCCRPPEKLPTIACVIALGGCKVRLYKCINGRDLRHDV